MLRTKQGCKIDPSIYEPRDVVDPLGVDTRVIRNQTHPGVFHEVHGVGKQNVDTWSNRRACVRLRARIHNQKEAEPLSTKPQHKHFTPVGLIATALCILSTATTAQSRTGLSTTIDSIMTSLTVEEKVGQLVMPWLLGSYTSESGEGFIEAMRWIDEIGIGGLVISTGSPIAAAAKLNAFQRRSKLPLIITADFEYGVAMRMSGSTGFPQPMGFGATGRELDAYQLGRITALESRAIGVHWTFSPVADLNNNPNNPIINTRSFGESPKDVAPLVAAYIRGASDHGLFTTAKTLPRSW